MMAYNTDDLSLPLEVVSKIITDSLPEDVKVTNEANQAISRAAVIFILITTSKCKSERNKNDQNDNKGKADITAQEMFDTILMLKFHELMKPLLEFHQEYLIEKEIKNKDNLKSESNRTINDISSPARENLDRLEITNQDRDYHSQDGPKQNDLL